ncbi:TolC family protein [Schlesneria sp. DSM 10557]|uniref:TolC family protein n=1 Tax=Schlesneria sp. DSM 10557 TaxID=3044399 RepID=UPI00359FC6E7
MKPQARMPIVCGCLLLTIASGCASVPSKAGADRGTGTGSGVTSKKQSGQTESLDSAGPLDPEADSLEHSAQLVAFSETEEESSATDDDNTDILELQKTSYEFLSPPIHAEDELAEDQLDLGEVVASVETHYPLLLAAVEEQGITSGQLLAAQGAFDLNLRAREFWQVGTYDSQRMTVGVDQNTAWNGLSYYTGYRQSDGSFPIYYGDRKTGDGGEFRAGVLIPLLAGRPIDKRRATARQAALTRALADPVIAAQRLDFIRAASRAYWTWVAAGRRYLIAQSVLKIAEDRNKQLAELVERGALAEIERTDNQRVIVERQARLITAERAWQQTSIALSLYLRNPEGEPLIPQATRLPRNLPEPDPFDPSSVALDIPVALQQRPELARLRLQRERTAVDLELARNQMLPGLNLGLEGAQDIGYASNFSKTPLVTGTELDRATYIASLQFDLPLQRREAKGRAMTAEAALTQLSFQEKFQRDRIVAELQDAASALERSYELLKKARENVAVARKVESGERERFTQGQGTIVILNIRELVAAEASFAEVDALAEFYRSMADYQAALGGDGPFQDGELNLSVPPSPEFLDR